jgi:N-acetyl-anhydromuramyl-L-alanine amidase AmpD
MPTRGAFKSESPSGALVHFTAGKHNAQSVIDYGIANGFCYHVIDRDGNFHQTHNLKRWGYHAGTSNYPGLGEGVSKFLIGIEITSAGLLKCDEKGKDGELKEVIAQAWFDGTPKKYTARYNGGSFGATHGWYEAFSQEQEHALVDFLTWCCKVFPKFNPDLILGHEEVAPKRKQDPGASLSMPMAKLRELIKSV